MDRSRRARKVKWKNNDYKSAAKIGGTFIIENREQGT
jgi:hypothetical protein